MHYDNNRPKYIRYALYSICIIVFAVLQNSNFHIPEIFGARAFILIPVAVSIAMHEREISSAIFGASIGVLWDLSASFDGLNAFVIMIICAVCSLLISHIMRNNLVTALVLNAGSLAVYQIVYIIVNFGFMGGGNPLRQMFTFYLPSFIYTMVFVPIFYGIIHSIYMNYKTTDE